MSLIKKYLVLIFCFSSVLLFAGDKIPEHTRKELKIGQYVVLMVNDTVYYAKIFGFQVNDNDEVRNVFLEFPMSLTEEKQPFVNGPFSVNNITKLYTYVEGLSDLRRGDAVFVEKRGSVGLVVGVYHHADGFSSHCIKFLGGANDGLVGCNWRRGDLHKVDKTEAGPMGSESYVYSKSQEAVYIVVGKVNDKQVLLKKLNNLKVYAISNLDDLTPIRTHNHIPLDPLEKEKDTAEKSKGHENLLRP